MTGDVSETKQIGSQSKHVNLKEKGGKSPHLHGETDVDQEVTAATGNERRCGWWKEDGDLGGKGPV